MWKARSVCGTSVSVVLQLLARQPFLTQYNHHYWEHSTAVRTQCTLKQFDQQLKGTITVQHQVKYRKDSEGSELEKLECSC